ncbi:hypothetical protein K32_29890 [Kaistia sp. 32K]|uniref:BA14K family protein n=1 Tax=Kaistia sp. 32K TaxID=2795690 RepID=UPI001935F6D2|nr:BA14K family protein [Kaistia sp. 32K]BCP54372.1 hypothetical protein K32_29890 [Kaistia sp. 32K]
MRSFVTASLAGVLGILAVSATATTASADGWYGGRHYYGHYHRDNSGAVIGGLAAGTLLGLGIGAIASQPRAYAYDYEVPPPRGAAWRAHVDYCLDRYRSYSPESDTFIGADGYEYRCRGSY